MAEITNELMYDVLKALRAEVGELREGQREIRTELQAVRGHVAATQTDVGNIYSILARQDIRLDRIERRLDIVDETVS
jgi:hypothetical protein